MSYLRTIGREGVISSSEKLTYIRFGLFIACLTFATLIILPLIWDIISLVQFNPFHPDGRMIFFIFVFNF